MPVLLGIDTGGTYTDAVLYDDVAQLVIASAKSLTTHHKLSIGILDAASAVLASQPDGPNSVGLVGLSTTLATNALTEGRGGRVGLISIGFDPSTLTRGGIELALDGGPVLSVAGGHGADGTEAVPLDLDSIETYVEQHASSVDAFAVVSEFSVRNPSHELAARQAIAETCDRPVSVSHELSPRLGGPQRAVTTILNGRLLALVDELLVAVRSSLAELGVNAPLVIVRGDGSLLSDTATTHTPIETILSGPAASIVGASHLVDEPAALVADIGGTTTDVAIMDGGRPRINPAGATVGGHQTMVRAVDVTTIGLGGDSVVGPAPTGLRQGRILVGPERLIPISMLAIEHGDFVLATIERQLRSMVRRQSFGRFVTPTGRAVQRSLSRVEQAVMADIGDRPVANDTFIDSGSRSLGVEKLERSGFVRQSGFTPTDAAHVLGIQTDFDPTPAKRAADLLAHVWSSLGHGPWADGEALARDVMAAVTRQSAELLLDVCLDDDGLGSFGTSTQPLSRAALDQFVGLVRPRISITAPIIGLGASAGTYHAPMAALLDTDVIVPDHSGVANAIGAVVGQVRTTQVATITQPSRGTYAVHGIPNNQRFHDLDEARRFLSDSLTAAVVAKAPDDGAADPMITQEWNDTFVDVNDKPYLVEAKLVVEAVARPRVA